MSWDVFICHASEDKEAIAKPLVAALVKAGLRVWYDDLTLALGDSLSRAIEQGLSASQFGVVILSPHFFAKKWPQRELNGLVAQEEHRDKVILPVWHGVTHEDVVRFSPSLADKIAVSTDQGVPAVVDKILRVIRPEAPPTEPAEAVITEPIAPQPDITPPSVEKTEVQVSRAPKTSSTPPRQSRAPRRRRPRQGQEIAPSITNTIDMYGSIKGIAGSTVGTVKALELGGGDESE